MKKVACFNNHNINFERVVNKRIEDERRFFESPLISEEDKIEEARDYARWSNLSFDINKDDPEIFVIGILDNLLHSIWFNCYYNEDEDELYLEFNDESICIGKVSEEKYIID